MSKKPVIGISPLYDTKYQSQWMLDLYLDAVEQSGGVPVVLSLSTRKENADVLVEKLDGIIIPGGEDVYPIFYNEDIVPELGVTVPQHDEMEMAVLKSAYEHKTPIMGICRGMQLMNVTFGGSLYQDINTQYKRENALVHRQLDSIPFAYPSHKVNVEEGTLFHETVGKSEVFVNSQHHQAVKDVAPCFKVSAKSPDGIIEAIETKDDQFAWGFQFHPEHLQKNYGDMKKLFEKFIAVCSK